MPVFFPSNVSTFSPTVNPVVFLSDNHGKGFGFFDGIDSGNTQRDSIAAGFRAPGFLAIVYDTSTPADSEMYIYASTLTTDAAWTTSSNWKNFTGASDTNLATNNLTQGSGNRTYDIPNGQILTFQGAGDEEFRITSSSVNSANEILLKAGQLKLYTAGAGAGRMAFLDGDESFAVTLSAPTEVTQDFQLTLPPNSAGADRLIQTNSTGVLSYAELSFTTNTLVIGAQSVDISAAGTNTNLATDNLTQDNETRTYDTNGNSLAFTNGGTGIFQIEGSAEFAAVINGKVLRFNEDANTDYVGLTAPAAVGTSYTLTLPDAVAAGDRLLQTDGSGNLSYAAVSFDSATDQIVIGAQSTDIGNVNTNLATDDLTQGSSSRTYAFSGVNHYLQFNTTGSGNFRVQDTAGEMSAVVQGSEDSHIGVSGGASKTFGFTPNTTQGGNVILKAPPGYTEAGIWYNDSYQVKFATPSFDTGTSTLVIGANSTVISSSGSNLGNSDLTSTESERKYGIGATSLTFTNNADTFDIFSITPSTLELGDGVPLRLRDGGGGGEYVGIDVPTSVTSYTLTLPDAVATGDRLIQTDSSGDLSYAEMTFSSNTLAIGAQSVELSFTGDNLATANLTQDDASRTYDIGNGTLTFKESTDNILKIDSTPAGSFESPYLVTFDGFQTIVPQTAGGGLFLDVDTDYITNDRFWGEIVELAPEASTFSVGQIVTFDGSNGLTTAINSDATRSSLSMFMAVTASATKKVMTRGYICLATSKVTGLSSTNDAGKAVYVDSTAGKMTITTPSGGAFMRLVGHVIQVNQGNSNCTIYFNPEGTVFKTT